MCLWRVVEYVSLEILAAVLVWTQGMYPLVSIQIRVEKIDMLTFYCPPPGNVFLVFFMPMWPKLKACWAWTLLTLNCKEGGGEIQIKHNWLIDSAIKSSNICRSQFGWYSWISSSRVLERWASPSSLWCLLFWNSSMAVGLQRSSIPGITFFLWGELKPLAQS